MHWLDIARKEVGQREVAGAANNARIVDYLNCTTYGSREGDETPWCSAFMNWVMKQAGLPYTKNAAARSWLSWGEPIHDPVPGCVVVFWRDSPQSWAGHVALYVGEGPNSTVTVLGGNQGNSVCEANYDKRRVLGFRWPKGIPIPEPVVAAPNAVTVDVEYIERLNASMLSVSQDLKTACEVLLNAANQIGAWAAALPLEEKAESINAG